MKQWHANFPKYKTDFYFEMFTYEIKRSPMRATLFMKLFIYEELSHLFINDFSMNCEQFHNVLIKPDCRAILELNK